MKKWMRIVFWIVFSLSTVLLWSFSRGFQHTKSMDEPMMHFTVQDGLLLMTETELLEKLRVENFTWEGITREELKVKDIEQYIADLNEVEAVDVYLQLDSKWHIHVLLKRPVLRVVFESGNSFYIDSHGLPMRLSKNSRPRVLSLTGVEELGFFERDLNQIINNDSLITKSLLRDSYLISNYVCNSAFYDALIVQLHFTKDDGFKLIPRVGGHEIIFGLASSEDEVDEKFDKLTTFYQDVIPFEGWGKYKSVNLKFRDQIVAKKKS